jgi:hypothetical protein
LKKNWMVLTVGTIPKERVSIAMCLKKLCGELFLKAFSNVPPPQEKICT